MSSSTDQLVEETRSSNFIAECANGRDEQNCADCTFEKDTCQWLDVSTGPFTWKRGQGVNVAPNNLGPAIDRTSLTSSVSVINLLDNASRSRLDTQQSSQGFYMYVQTSDGFFYDDAILELQQVLQQSSATCELEFWHFMGSRQYLSVHLLYDDQSIDLWEEARDHSNSWLRVLLPLGRITHPWRLQFLAERSWDDGSVAIDDVRLVGCRFPPVRANCSESEFRCNRGACISKDRLCDWT
jgi:hypothetical protein